MSDPTIGNGKGTNGGQQTGVVVKAKPKTKKPSMYKVLMLHVHHRGVGICGVFTYEVAETKVTQVMDFARQHQHPLQCTLEKD